MSELRRPATKFQRIVRELAIAAQETLYHDIDESQPEWLHGVQNLEPIFSRILRGKIKADASLSRLRRPQPNPDGND